MRRTNKKQFKQEEIKEEKKSPFITDKNILNSFIMKRVKKRMC